MCLNQQKQGICPTNIIEYKLYDHSTNISSNKFIVENDVFDNISDNKSTNQISIAGGELNICPRCPPGIVVQKFYINTFKSRIYIYIHYLKLI